jgi:hypothetical protein
MTDYLKNKLSADIQDNLDLKNVIKLEENDYNLNAVHSVVANYAEEANNSLTSDVADQTQAKLTLNKSLVGSIESVEFNGSEEKNITFVPSDGGKFTGDVHIHSGIKSLKDITDNDIINYGQIDTAIKLLDGAPLYTWDTREDYNAIKNNEGSNYKLNTVIGSIEDLPILEAYSEGVAHNLYITPDSYDNAYIRYGETWYDAYWNEAYNDVKNTITKLVFKGSMESEQGDTKYIKIRGSSFYNMRGLTSVHINEGVYELGTGAFSGCASLKSISIPESVTTIGKEAFQGCEALTGIVLGSKITEIKTATFKGCKNLKSIVVCNNNITSIASDAFSGCEKLTRIYFKGTQAEWNAISNNPIKSGVNRTVIPIDGTAFPFLYICKDEDIIDTSLTSNKMFLKLPNKPLVEISKGAARLERRDSKTSGNVDYFTYDVLAAVIAGINSRITALGSQALALPEQLKIYDSDSTAVLNIPTKIANEHISTEENKNLIVEETTVASVPQLQEQITKLTNGTYTDTDYKDVVLKAKADEDGRNIKKGYYQSANTSNINKITISTTLPTTSTSGNNGDIIIVV